MCILSLVHLCLLVHCIALQVLQEVGGLILRPVSVVGVVDNSSSEGYQVEACVVLVQISS